jgi:hypothetical protein
MRRFNASTTLDRELSAVPNAESHRHLQTHVESRHEADLAPNPRSANEVTDSRISVGVHDN